MSASIPLPEGADVCDEPNHAFPDPGHEWRRPPAQRSCALEGHYDVVSLTKQRTPPRATFRLLPFVETRPKMVPGPQLLLLLYYHYGSSLLFRITLLASSSTRRRHDNGLFSWDFLFSVPLRLAASPVSSAVLQGFATVVVPMETDCLSFFMPEHRLAHD